MSQIERRPDPADYLVNVADRPDTTAAVEEADLDRVAAIIGSGISNGRTDHGIASEILAALSQSEVRSALPPSDGRLREALTLVERVKEHASDDRPMVTWVPAADLYTVAEFLRSALSEKSS